MGKSRKKGTREMNEKIKELALDAGIGFTLWDDSGRPMIDNYTPEEYLEKFAQLIVKECALLCSDPVVILQHFGLDSKSQ